MDKGRSFPVVFIPYTFSELLLLCTFVVVMDGSQKLLYNILPHLHNIVKLPCLRGTVVRASQEKLR